MSRVHKKRGSWPPIAGDPWTAKEDALVRTLRPEEVVKRTKRTRKAVWSRRQTLGLSDGRANRRMPITMAGRWTREEDRLIKRLSSAEAAKRLGRTQSAVWNRRYVLRLLERRVDKGRKSNAMSRRKASE
jgi:hypothetical protein